MPAWLVEQWRELPPLARTGLLAAAGAAVVYKAAKAVLTTSPAAMDACLRLGSRAVERHLVPDCVLRAGIRTLLRQRLAELPNPDTAAPSTLFAHKLAFVREITGLPTAIATDAANAQHYEVPTVYYDLCLGPRKKYSACLYPRPGATLAEAEEAAFDVVCERAELRDAAAGEPGLEVLDLGCGWGSLSLYLLERFPTMRVTSLSNSRTQRAHILATAAAKGGDAWTSRLQVLTQDANALDLPHAKFDRVCSIEMLEHMKNYGQLFKSLGKALKPGGVFFVHIFVHRSSPYHFETPQDRAPATSGANAAAGATVTTPGTDDGLGIDGNWMARYFFAGGTMPSPDLLHYFCGRGNLGLEAQWAQDGTHYGQTCEHWLQEQDKHHAEVVQLFEGVYGSKAAALTWAVRWRLFYLSCAELFNFRGGKEWFVAHYRFRATGMPANA